MFFVFEGGDGSGKSTQARLLAQRLERDHRLPVLTVREPGATALGEELREMLLAPREENLAAETELYLFMAARSHLVRERILPALARGEIVVSDRFLWSSAAYQGAAASVDPAEVLRIGRLAVEGVEVTRTFLIDLDPDLAHARTVSGDRMVSTRFDRREGSFILIAQKQGLTSMLFDFLFVDLWTVNGRSRDIIRGNARDTTLIRLLDGSRAYLHAVIDNFSRRILAWKVSATFDSSSRLS